MLKDNAIPIRLDTETKERLKAAAEKLGLSSSALIRMMIVSFVDSFESTGASVTLPLHWDISDRAHSPRLRPPSPRR